MANGKQIGLEAVFENEDFNRGISEYNKDISDATASTQDAGSVMSGVWSGLAAVGEIAFTAIAAGIAAFAAELFIAVDAALDTEEVLARMEFVVNNVGERTGVASEDVLRLADSLSQVVPIDDEVIVSAITMGLTFDGVTKDNIEPLIAAAADLATWTGKDLPATMRTLSLAISDPEKAMRLFREANITLTDAEEKTLDGLGKMGDTAGITSFILEKLATKGIIGLGEAMAETGRGKLTIMQTAIGNLNEALGEGLLDALKDVFDRLTVFANDPKVIGFFSDLGTRIGDFAESVLDTLPSIITVLGDLGDWFVEHQALIIGVLAAIGVAMIAFSVIAIEAAVAAIAGFWPIILAMGLIGAAAALLFTAWTEDWGGIQGLTAEAWAAIEPIVTAIWEWLQINIPIALQFLSDLWEDVLLPAIQAVFEWIVTNLIPLWISMVEWLQVNIPLAIQALSGFWTGKLLPAIQSVWSWINANLIPLFESIARLMSAVVGLAITAMAGLWQNVLLPAIQEVGAWIQENLNPIFESIGDVINDSVMPALSDIADFLSNVLVAAFDGITSAIQDLIDWIDDLTDALLGVTLPPALTPGSPTPFEIGLRGINEQLARMADTILPTVQHQLNVLGTVRDVPGANSASASNSIVTNSQATHNYLFGAQFTVNSRNGLLDILNGLR